MFVTVTVIKFVVFAVIVYSVQLVVSKSVNVLAACLVQYNM